MLKYISKKFMSNLDCKQCLSYSSLIDDGYAMDYDMYPDSAEYTKKYRSKALLFNIFENQKKQVLNYLQHDYTDLLDLLWTGALSPLSADLECQDNLRIMSHINGTEQIGKERKRRQKWHPKYRCPACISMYKLIDLDNIPSSSYSSSFILLDQSYSLIKFETIFPHLEVNPDVNHRLKKLTTKHKEIYKCEPGLMNLEDIVYVQCDELTNKLLVSWIAGNILRKYNINTIIEPITGFFCGSDGYILSPVYNTIDSLLITYPNKINFVKSLLLQLILSLNILQDLHLSISKFDFSVFKFSREFFNSEFDGIKIQSDFTLKLDITDSASINWKNIRFYNGTEVSEHLMNNLDFDPNIKTINFTRFDDDNYDVGPIDMTDEIIKKHEINIYSLPSRSGTSTADDNNIAELTLMMLRKIGYPLYQSSFNSYVLMIALMTNPIIRNIIYEDINLRKIWFSLWVPSQFMEITNRLDNLALDIDSINIISILNGLYLRCDATSHLWNKIKMI